MEERHVTVDGTDHDVPRPFVVIATQNPVEQEGTYRLPEAQLDRFLMRTALGYPDHDHEVDVLRMLAGRDRARGPVAGHVDARRAHDDPGRRVGARRGLDPQLRRAAVRGDPDDARAAPRGVDPAPGAIARSAKAWALAAGRPGRSCPDDVRVVAPAVMGHRMLLTPEAELGRVDADDLVDGSSTAVRARRPADVPRWAPGRRGLVVVIRRCAAHRDCGRTVVVLAALAVGAWRGPRLGRADWSSPPAWSRSARGRRAVRHRRAARRVALEPERHRRRPAGPVVRGDDPPRTPIASRPIEEHRPPAGCASTSRPGRAGPPRPCTRCRPSGAASSRSARR